MNVLNGERRRLLYLRMGNVIKVFMVKSSPKEKPQRLRLNFDTGSPITFVKESAASKFANVFDLAEPESFGGLGFGKFKATRYMLIHVKLLEYWCRHSAFVVDDLVLDSGYDILIGHDFMQVFDITIRTKKRNDGVILNPTALRLAQTVL